MNDLQNEEPFFITEEIEIEMKAAGYIFEPPAHVSTRRLRDVLTTLPRVHGDAELDALRTTMNALFHTSADNMRGASGEA